MPTKQELRAHQARLRVRQQQLDELQQRQVAVQHYPTETDGWLDAQQQREVEAQRYQLTKLQQAVESSLASLPSTPA